MLKFNMDVRIRQEVVAIDQQNKTVTVKNTKTGETYEESYDTLVLSTGSSPIKPPIPGIDFRAQHDALTVRTPTVCADHREKNAKSAVVVGRRVHRLEMAEKLRHAGLDVTL